MSPRRSRGDGTLSGFQVGDRVGAKPEVVEKSDSDWPWYGHVVNVGGQGLVWVRDHLGGEWGLPASSLEHID